MDVGNGLAMDEAIMAVVLELLVVVLMSGMEKCWKRD
jgi:hypothetical protein